MGRIEDPSPVKLFCAMLAPSEDIFRISSRLLEDRVGGTDLESNVFPFGYTDYYEEEMGPSLLRKFISFQGLVHPHSLPRYKILTNGLEEEITSSSEISAKRAVNLDPGYIGLSKVVLATTKNYAHRIYLKDGIYAEVTLRYKEGSFEPYEWTYPDYRSEEYIEYLNQVRERYKKQLDSS